jgi:hypothetical protein
MLQRPIAFPLNSAGQDLVVDGLHVERAIHARVPRMYRRPRGRLVLFLWFFPHGGWTGRCLVLYVLNTGAIVAGGVHDELQGSIESQLGVWRLVLGPRRKARRVGSRGETVQKKGGYQRMDDLAGRKVSLALFSLSLVG